MLNYNPFDRDYAGPDFIFIDSLVPHSSYYIISGDTVFYGRSVKIYAHKTYDCGECECTFFENGEAYTIPNPFINDKVQRTVSIPLPGIYTFEAALGSMGVYSKHSEPKDVSFK